MSAPRSAGDRPRVALTLNAGLGEVRYFERVVRHDVRALNYPFAQKLVAYDCSQPRGRMHTGGTPDQLRQLMSRLVDDGVIDRADEIPWDSRQPELEASLNRKYFADPNVPTRAHGGTPIFHYLFALDQVDADYLLHLDADILFHCPEGATWIDESIALMESEQSVVMTSPPGGPPRGRLPGDALGRPRRKRADQPRWHRSGGVSARYFLADWERLRALRPWVREQVDELFEESLSHTLRARKAERWTMNGTDCYALHLHRRTPGFYKHLDDLIWAVENNVYPYWRTGHNWDLRTDRLGLVPWLCAIRWARAKRALGLG